MTLLFRWAALVLAALLTGCLAHVSIPQAPDESAPLEDRIAYANAWAASGTHTVSKGRSTVMSLVLENGTEVQDPKDLIPAVGANGIVGKAALTADSERADYPG